MDTNYTSEQRNLRNIHNSQNYGAAQTPEIPKPQYQPEYPPQKQPEYPPQYQTQNQPQYQPAAPVPVYQRQISRPQNVVPIQYARPVVIQPVQLGATIMVSQPVVHNQTFISRTLPSNINCPFCKMPITTQTRLSLNFQACCMCIFCTFIFFCMQCLNNKDCGCYDCEHICPNCGNMVGKYHAM